MSFRLKTILGIALIEAVLLAVLIVSGLRWLQESNQAQLLQRAETSVHLFAALTKDAVLLGMGSYFELWDKATYEAKETAAMQAEMPDVFKDFSF